MSDPVRVTIYSREVCPLCEEAKETVDAVVERVEADATVEEVDVDTDPDLREQYGERVPYVFVDGTPKFKFRVDARELERAITDAAE
ncbi:glutaredoxin family protein [Halospeciosus flavus]|uniref:Glutaredoxin family protein n=1 Tax=Halospeciosus flavus TaxID=3032283 RepID=A0ABD5Z6V6_9EURY|nr:glutaredoxin family protein [Halospeciosus flavus]